MGFDVSSERKSEDKGQVVSHIETEKQDKTKATGGGGRKSPDKRDNVSFPARCQIYVDNITKFFKTDNKVNDGKTLDTSGESKLKKSSPRETKENKKSDEFEKIEKAKEMCEEAKAGEESEKQTSCISPTERKKKKSPPGSDPSRDSRNNSENLKEQNQIQETPIIGPEVTNTNISQDNKVIDPK